MTDAVFRAEMWQRVGRTGGRTDISPCITEVFLPKTVTVSKLLLFDHVTLLCGTFLFILLSGGHAQLSDCQTDTPLLCAAGLSIHTGLVRPYCASDTTSRGVSATEWNFHPSHLRDIHTKEEAENWRRIPVWVCNLRPWSPQAYSCAAPILSALKIVTVVPHVLKLHDLSNSRDLHAPLDRSCKLISLILRPTSSVPIKYSGPKQITFMYFRNSTFRHGSSFSIQTVRAISWTMSLMCGYIICCSNSKGTGVKLKMTKLWLKETRANLLLAKPVAISYSQPNDSMVLHHSCSANGPWAGSTGETISSRAEVCVYLYTLLLSLLLRLLSLLRPLSFIHWPHMRTLPHSRSPTHTLRTLRRHTWCTALFLKGATLLLHQWQLQMQETHWQNLNPLLFHWSRPCGSI